MKVLSQQRHPLQRAFIGLVQTITLDLNEKPFFGFRRARSEKLIASLCRGIPRRCKGNFCRGWQKCLFRCGAGKAAPILRARNIVTNGGTWGERLPVHRYSNANIA